ncbi:coiled-coil domain-containing protein 186-like, partial [Diabrotica virgifera virgifera]
NSSLNVSDRSVDRPNTTIDQQTLIEHVVKLQKISAKKSEKIDFLEEHVNTLVIELQKKSKLLQGYILREQKTSNSIKKDSNKVK